MISYRTDKQTGEWCLLGPASELRPGEQVSVQTKSGKTRVETVASVSRPFDRDGVPHVYAHIRRPDAAKTETPQTTAKTTTRKAVQDALACLAELRAALEEMLGQAQPAPQTEHRQPPRHEPIPEGDVPW